MMGMDKNLYTEVNKIDDDYDNNRYRGRKGDIFQNRKPYNKILVRKPKS